MYLPYRRPTNSKQDAWAKLASHRRIEYGVTCPKWRVDHTAVWAPKLPFHAGPSESLPAWRAENWSESSEKGEKGRYGFRAENRDNRQRTSRVRGVEKTIDRMCQPGDIFLPGGGSSS